MESKIRELQNDIAEREALRKKNLPKRLLDRLEATLRTTKRVKANMERLRQLSQYAALLKDNVRLNVLLEKTKRGEPLGTGGVVKVFVDGKEVARSENDDKTFLEGVIRRGKQLTDRQQ